MERKKQLLINRRAKIIRGSTPLHVFTSINEGFDFTKATEISIEYKQDTDVKFIKSGDDISVLNDKQISTNLTSADTLELNSLLLAHARVIAYFGEDIKPSKNTVDFTVEEM